MKIFFSATRAVKKRRMMFLYVGILLLFFVGADYLMPISTLIRTAMAFSRGTLLDSIVGLMGILIQPKVLLNVFLKSAEIILVLSFLFTVFFSYVFENLNAYFKNRQKPKKVKEVKFFVCIRKHFIRLFLTFLRVCAALFLFVIALLISTVPAIMITRAASSNGGYWIVFMMIVNIITVVTIFLAFYYVRMYLAFWFPAAVKYKKSFKASKIIVNNNFFKLLPAFIITDIIFLMGAGVAVYGLSQKSVSWTAIPLTALGLILLDIVLVYFYSYIFAAFKFYVDKHKTDRVKIAQRRQAQTQRYDDDDDDEGYDNDEYYDDGYDDNGYYDDEDGY